MNGKYNSLDASVMLYGVNYGDHIMRPDTLVAELSDMLEGTANAFLVRLWHDVPLEEKTYIEIAEFAKSKNIPFGFLYATQHAPKGEISHISPKIYEKIGQICGELFIGEVFGEAGSESGAKDKGYYTEGRRPNHSPMPPQDTLTMSDARREYVDRLKGITAYDRSLSMNTMIVEATALSSYALEAGINVPILELCPGGVEELTAFTRGAAVSYNRKMWGGFIAHEWYGGFRHFDGLKIKRLDMLYKYLFMSGANIILLESGTSEIDSYGVRLGYSSPLCETYRRVMKENYRLFTKNPRLPHGPVASVAFVMGRDDGYTGFMGGSAWCRFDREEWGKSDAERSWDILKSIYKSDTWAEPLAYAQDGKDFGNSLAYGTYDVISANASYECMKNYGYLIFLGWNTMTEELYRKLVEYVKGGGVLLMSAAHLNVNSSRKRKYECVMGGDLTELFGCRLNGCEHRNHGVKFSDKSAVYGLQYPGTPDRVCDPIFFDGFADRAVLELCGAEAKAVMCDKFGAPDENAPPAVVEYRCGDGIAILTSNVSYPGDPAIMPMYSRLVKALLNASHAAAPLHVFGSDKVRFSLFGDGADRYTLYLLNTDFEVRSTVNVEFNGYRASFTLEPSEFKMINI